MSDDTIDEQSNEHLDTDVGMEVRTQEKLEGSRVQSDSDIDSNKHYDRHKPTKVKYSWPDLADLTQ